MANFEFSAPYNDDPETLKEIFRLKRLGNNSLVIKLSQNILPTTTKYEQYDIQEE